MITQVSDPSVRSGSATVPTPASPATEMQVDTRSQGYREHHLGKLLPWVPCTLALEVAVIGFTVNTLLNLVEGSLVHTTCHQSTDVPLQVNGVHMAWTEFEVVGERLAARITDLV